MKQTISNFLKISLICAMLMPLTAAQQTTNVVICTGNYATTYHKHSQCSGMNNCKGDRKTVTLEQAKKMGRRACKVCHK
ncbi:hypothetical protein LJC57_01355 [Parabacteroides sp. OttesenSCG-928-G07]|nr:hypothetical protein [Parabacteroides sp. OttesenSCG-928-G07]